MRDNWLVSVGAGRFQLPGIRAAQDNGLRVLAIDGNLAALGFSVADKSTVADIRSPDAVVKAVIDLGIKPAGAIAFVTEAGMRAAGQLRDEFSLYGPGLELSSRLSDKYLQRSVWRDTGLPCPEWYVARTEHDAKHAIEAINGTVIFKPVDSAGGRSVTVVEPDKDWRPAFEAALKTSLQGKVLIESYFTGTEYTVETFAHRGDTAVLAVTEKQKVPGTSSIVSSGLTSSSVGEFDTRSIGELAKGALAALGHTDGPGHTEILRNAAGELCLVETAGRAGGFMIADGLVPKVAGFNLARATARQAAGLDPGKVPNIPSRPFSFRWLRSFAEHPRKVTNISGFDNAQEADVTCEPFVSVGDIVGPYDPDRPRLGYVLALGESRSVAVAKSREAELRTRIELSELV